MYDDIIVDEKISSTSFYVDETRLNKVYVKNNKNFPWIILIPNTPSLYDLVQLGEVDWLLLREDIIFFSNWIKSFFMSQKINIASIGNIVQQLHIHIVGRKTNDSCWPNSVWHVTTPQNQYDNCFINNIILSLKKDIKRYKKI